MPLSTVTSKGQITLPKEVRDFLKAEAGTKLDFIIQASGQVLVKPVDKPVRDLKGLLHRPGRKPVTMEQMQKAIKAGASRLT